MGYSRSSSANNAFVHSMSSSNVGRVTFAGRVGGVPVGNWVYSVAPDELGSARLAIDAEALNLSRPDTLCCAGGDSFIRVLGDTLCFGAMLAVRGRATLFCVRKDTLFCSTVFGVRRDTL